MPSIKRIPHRESIKKPQVFVIIDLLNAAGDLWLTGKGQSGLGTPVGLLAIPQHVTYSLLNSGPPETVAKSAQQVVVSSYNTYFQPP